MEFVLRGDRAYKDYFVGDSEKSILDATQGGTTYTGGQKYESHRIVPREEMDGVKSRMTYPDTLVTSINSVLKDGIKCFRIGQVKVMGSR